MGRSSKSGGSGRRMAPSSRAQLKHGMKWWHPVLAVSAIAITCVLHQIRSNPLTYLDVSSEQQMTEVFSKEKWVVLCLAGASHVPPVFAATAAKMRKEDVRFGILDCSAELPSGRSTLERFKQHLNPRLLPVFFVTSPDGLPTQIDPRSVNSRKGQANFTAVLRVSERK